MNQVASKHCQESLTIQTHRVLPNDLNHHGTLFGGTLLSIIDNTASIAASRHGRRLCVTASVDSMNFIHPISGDHSVCVECYVSGVGSTSVEVFAKVMGEELVTGNRYLAATCFITFVALKRDNEESFNLPNVIPETEEEKMVCSGYEKRRALRLENRKLQQSFNQSLSHRVPWLNHKDS